MKPKQGCLHSIAGFRICDAANVRRMPLKSAIKSAPIIGPFMLRVVRRLRRGDFTNSADYWEKRYRAGGTSRAGS
jgi:hypothetical protein